MGTDQNANMLVCFRPRCQAFAKELPDAERDKFINEYHQAIEKLVSERARAKSIADEALLSFATLRNNLAISFVKQSWKM